jgi:glycine/D-amino acid oxidase-like deaminating enzyme
VYGNDRIVGIFNMLNRRKFLGGMTAATAMGVAGPLVHGAVAATGVKNVNRVAVIGAGIVGASIAYNLSKRGCEVIVIEKRAPASQASGNSFAWINASYFDAPDSYFVLRTHSLNEYHRLAQDVDIPIRWGGSLEWYDDATREKEVVDGVRRIQDLGAPTWMIDNAKAKEIEPRLMIPGEQQIAWSSRDGAVDPAGVTWALLRRVTIHGGQVVYPATVTSMETHANGIRVVTDTETYEVDLAVAATGAGTSDIAAMMDLETDPMRTSTPGIIVTTEPMGPLLNSVVYNLDSHIHQLSDGRVLVGEKAGPPATDQHHALLQERPNVYPDNGIAGEHAARVLHVASRYVPQLAEASVASVGVGWRPLPQDGLPVIGQVQELPQLYLAAMHSGVTLAPIVGHLAAMEILDGVRVSLLNDFRYERF